MKNDAQEGKHHGEQHPHIDQLHIYSLRQRVVDPGKTYQAVFITMRCEGNMVPYNVVKTRRMVRLTSITMSMYSSENIITVWLQGDSKVYRKKILARYSSLATQ